MPDTTSKEPEDGFTFVDKRRGPDESSNATDSLQQTERPADTATSQEEAAPSEADIEEMLAGMPDLSVTTELAKYVVSLLTMNAFQQLGLIADPKIGSVRKDLQQARLAIDCVAGLVGAIDTPQSGLDTNTKNELRRVLTDLRLNFVNQSRADGQSPQ